MSQFKKRYQLGFTLIELMVVVAIIGILMAAGIVAFSGAQRNARDARRKADVDAIAKALEQRYADTGNYMSLRYLNSLSTSWNDATGQSQLGIYFPSGLIPVDVVNVSPYYLAIASIEQNRSGAANPQTRFCVSVRLEASNGNCSGFTGPTLGDTESFKCNWSTPGTGSQYCVANRQ